MDTDQAQGVFGCFSATVLFVFAVIAIVNAIPETKPVETDNLYAETACVDGIVQQGRPGDWKPVNIRKSKRTIPCEANQ